MNSDSSREPFEAQLTALLLGELAPEEAVAMERAIQGDAELARLRDQIAQTIELVREASNTPAEAASNPATRLRLPQARRNLLLQSFKTVRPREFAKPEERELAWVVPMGIAAALVVLIGLVAFLPDFGRRARRASFAMSVSNGRGYEAKGQLKEQLALPNGLFPGAPKQPTTVTVAEAPPPKQAVDAIVLPSVDFFAKEQAGMETGTAASSNRGESQRPENSPATALPRLAITTTNGFGFEAGENKTLAGVPGGGGGGGIGGGGGGFGGGVASYGGFYAPRVDVTQSAPADKNGGAFPIAGSSMSKTAGLGLNDQIPVLGDKPALGRFFREQAAQAGQNSGTPDAGVVTASANNNGVATENAFVGRYAYVIPPNEPLTSHVIDSKSRLGEPVPALAGREIASVSSVPLPQTAVPPPALLADQERFDDAKKAESAPQPTRAGDESSTAVAWSFDSAALVPGNAANIPAAPPAKPTDAKSDAEMAHYQMDPKLMARYGLMMAPPPKVPSRESGSIEAEKAKMAGKDALVEVEKSSNEPVKRDSTPRSGVSAWADYNSDGFLSLSATKPQSSGSGIDPTTGQPLPPDSVAATAGEQPNAIGLRIEPTTGSPLPDLKQTASPGGPPNLAVTLDTSGGIVQTLEPETTRNLERERIVAEGRAAGFQRTLEQLKETGLGKVMHSPAEEGVLRGLQVQADAQKSLATSLGSELAERQELKAPIELPAKSESLVKADPEARKVITLTASDGSIATQTQAQPEKAPGLWDRVREFAGAKVERTARVDVQPAQPDTPPLLYGATSQNSFDPYFIQTEFEKIKSKSVLYKVIDRLHLNETWAAKHGAHANPTTPETYQLLVKNVDVRQTPDGRFSEIRVRSEKPDEAAQIANTIAEVYREVRAENQRQSTRQLAEWQERQAELAKQTTDTSAPIIADKREDAPPPKLAPSAPVPQPDVQTRDNSFSTFSLNVADVSFKLAAANLEKGLMPDPATVRSEEFLNAFDYRDPEPPPGVPVAFAWERSRYPFTQDRDLLRFSIKTAAQGRQPGYPLNLVLLLDKSGSMERVDRVATIREALRVLAGQLQSQDKLSVVTFARTARLWADGVNGNEAGAVVAQVTDQTPEGGTNLEDALNLAYQTALKHYIHGGGNRVVLLTDGAANLGDVNPEALQRKVETLRQQGVALDCFGIGWEGFNDDLLEVLSSHGDGRYGFLNTPEEAATGFAGQLAGALRIAAADVKVQVEFNPKRVTVYRQIGYAKHQLTKEQFRDNTVDAAEMGAAESGNALYVVQVNPRGEGDLGVVRVRYKMPSTNEYREQEWPVPYTGNATPLEQANPAQRLAAVASSFSEWLVSSPYSGEVTPDRLLKYLRGVPEVYGADSRPTKLEWMIRQAKSISGK